MSLFTNFLLVCVLNLALYKAEDLQAGTTVNAQLVYQETVEYSAIPFFSMRTHDVFYRSPNSRNIKGVSAIDADKSRTKPTISAGGVGQTFINVKLESEKGKGLNYLVQIFV